MLRHPRLLALLSAAGLVLGLSGLAPVGAGAADAASPLSLWLPDRVVVQSYGGEVYDDLGLRVVATGGPFELRSTRASYDEPIRTVWRSAAGDVELPAGAMSTFAGLDGFVTLTMRRVSDGSVARRVSRTGCPAGEAQRVRPDAPARSPYPSMCPWHPYTLGSVMGIQDGYSTALPDTTGASVRLRAGRYDVTASIAPAYAGLFGIAAGDATATTRLVVRDEGGAVEHGRARERVLLAAGTRPRTASVGTVAGPLPDLRTLPAFSIALNGRGTAIRFGATVWNAGDSPLVVEGFRSGDGQAGDDRHLDAYQYFFDADGNQTGHQSVGQMHWHAENHRHWHFEDFATYSLLSADRTREVRSTKQSFCLANTDAVDYTVPGADWQPDHTDLGSSCGGQDALSVRQVLAAGSGDTYFQYRFGQAISVKGLPNGVYHLRVAANPLGQLVESDATNNDSLRKIRLGGRPGDRWVRVPQVGIVDEVFPGFR